MASPTEASCYRGQTYSEAARKNRFANFFFSDPRFFTDSAAGSSTTAGSSAAADPDAFLYRDKDMDQDQDQPHFTEEAYMKFLQDLDAQTDRQAEQRLDEFNSRGLRGSTSSGTLGEAIRGLRGSASSGTLREAIRGQERKESRPSQRVSEDPSKRLESLFNTSLASRAETANAHRELEKVKQELQEAKLKSAHLQSKVEVVSYEMARKIANLTRDLERLQVNSDRSIAENLILRDENARLHDENTRLRENMAKVLRE